MIITFAIVSMVLVAVSAWNYRKEYLKTACLNNKLPSTQFARTGILSLCCSLSFSGISQAETISQALYAPVNNLDPVYTTTSENYVYSGNLFDPLIVLGKDSQILPAQAKSWEVSSDGLQYTFQLRDDITWSDGHPVTSEDFVLAFRRLADASVNKLPKPTYLLSSIENALDILNGTAPIESLGVSATDERTVVFNLEIPASYFLSVLTYPGLAPVPSHIIEKVGDDWDKQLPLVSNGPYSLVSRGETQDILTRNEGYWSKELPAVLELITYDSQKSVMADLMSGKLDIASDLPRSQTQWLNKSFPGQIADHLSNGTVYTMFNTDREHLSDPDVRRALAMSVDKRFLVQRLHLELQQSASTFSVPTLLNASSEMQPNWMNMDFRARQFEAKKLLEKAGYSAENPLKIALLYGKTFHMDKVATFLKSAWSEIGVDVDAEFVGSPGLSPRLNAREYEVSLAVWFADYPHPMTFLSLLRSNASKNRTGWASADYDELLNAAMMETNLNNQTGILEKLELILQQEVPIFPLFHPSFTLVTSGKIGEYRGFGYELLARNVFLDK